MITPDDERRFGLPPLPAAPFCGRETAERLNLAFTAERLRYRQLNPHRDVKREDTP